MADSINRVLAQPKQHPTLANLKRVCPQDLAHCEGYVWHQGTRIGKGSFGEVYLGWSSDGLTEVAVKVVRKEFFKQDPKVRENLEREIRILKLLRGCEYVVHLYHVQELKQHIVLVMELCEFDLDHLVKIKPFKEQDIIIFLYQLAQGMKALREQNIVHRDLKPGNILIKRHPTTGKMMIKLADFGFARHFKDEGMKHIDMTSLAGTPVFMAPEALRCVFHPGEHYDDKVDIWSIGALLYKVIVGQCGFYAQLQDIPRILRKKGDAIAFERIPRSSKINFIYELPEVVNDRLSEPFREKMNNLLRAMLKLDPAERMTFDEFYTAVDDIITSKIEIVNLLHGTSMKVMDDPQLTVESLTDEVYSDTHVPRQFQVLFSNSSKYFISPYTTLSPEHFSQLLEESGGSRGHAKLYLLPVNLVESDTLTPDYSCLAGLGIVIVDEESCVSQIVDHKLSDEMVHMIHNMSASQKSQLEGLNELCKFISREVEQFGSHGYKQLTEMGYQALAKANLAIQWLQQDLSSLSDKNQGQLGALLQTVNQNKTAIEQLVQELSGFNSSAIISVSVDVKEEDLLTAANQLSEESKKLPKLRKDHIYSNCKTIYDDCQKLISEVTEKVKGQLRPLLSRLSQVWRLCQTSENLRRACSTLDVVLGQVSMERSTVLRSLSGSMVQGTLAQGTPPPLLVTPPHGGGSWTGGPFPGPPLNMSTWAMAPSPSSTSVETIKQEKAALQSEVERLNAELSTLRLSASGRRHSSGSYDDEQQTIRPGTTDRLRPHSPSDIESTVKPGSIREDSVRTLESLTGQLKKFCTTAEKLRPGISVNTSTAPPRTPTTPQGGALYPSLMDGLSANSMPEHSPSSSQSLPDNLDALMPKALRLAELLKDNADNIVKTSARGTVTISANSGLVKIGRPLEYEEGDIVIFSLIRLVKSKRNVPALLHLERPHPYILMDDASFGVFNFRQGKIPELVLGKLTERPRRFKFESHPSLAEDLSCSSGDFYMVKAEPTTLKFSAPHSPVQTAPPKHSTAPPTRPPPPTAQSRSESDKKKYTGLFSRHKKGGFV